MTRLITWTLAALIAGTVGVIGLRAVGQSSLEPITPMNLNRFVWVDTPQNRLLILPPIDDAFQVCLAPSPMGPARGCVSVGELRARARVELGRVIGRALIALVVMVALEAVMTAVAVWLHRKG